MKRLYEFITKANQVLLFVALLGLIGLLVFLTHDSLSTGTGPQVSVAAPTAAPEKQKIRNVKFLGKSGAHFVFGIIRETVSLDTPSSDMQLAGPAKRKPRGESEEEIVNIAFSDGKKIVKMLLPHDGLVIRRQLAEIHDYETFSAHIFTCIPEDTNGDKVLDLKDRQDLVIVDPKLQRPDIVVKGALDVETISRVLAVVKSGTSENPRFIEIDASTGGQSEVAWK